MRWSLERCGAESWGPTVNSPVFFVFLVSKNLPEPKTARYFFFGGIFFFNCTPKKSVKKCEKLYDSSHWSSVQLPGKQVAVNFHQLYP